MIILSTDLMVVAMVAANPIGTAYFNWVIILVSCIVLFFAGQAFNMSFIAGKNTMAVPMTVLYRAASKFRQTISRIRCEWTGVI